MLAPCTGLNAEGGEQHHQTREETLATTKLAGMPEEKCEIGKNRIAPMPRPEPDKYVCTVHARIHTHRRNSFILNGKYENSEVINPILDIIMSCGEGTGVGKRYTALNIVAQRFYSLSISRARVPCVFSHTLLISQRFSLGKRTPSNVGV